MRTQKFSVPNRLARAMAALLFIIRAAAAASAQDRKVVRLHIPGFSPNSLSFQIAEEKGFHREEGITLQKVRMKTGAGVQAMLAENADASQILRLTLRAAISRGAPVKIVMVFNSTAPSRAMLKNAFRFFDGAKCKN